jgi:hypothetical protein
LHCPFFRVQFIFSLEKEGAFCIQTKVYEMEDNT